jgi:hypothetical protein
MKLSRQNQVYYLRLFAQTYKHYKDRQSLLKHKLITKVIKNAQQQGLGGEILDPSNLTS